MPSEAPEPSLLLPILRQWWLVLMCIAVFCGAAWVYIKKARPLYTSYTRIYIEPTPADASAQIGVTQGENFLPAQVDIIKSAKILNRVAEIDGMRAMRTFEPAHGNPVLFLRENLDVKLDRKTDLITIALESPYPEETTRIVDAVYTAYSENSLQEKDDLSQKILEQFRKNLETAQAEGKQLREQFNKLQMDNPTVSPNPAVQSIADQAARQIAAQMQDAELKLVDEQARFGFQHQTVLNRMKQLTELRKMYDDAIGQLRNEHNVAGELKNVSLELDRNAALIQSLQTQIRTMETAANSVKRRQIEVIDPPAVPTSPSSPKRYRILAVAIVLGGLLGSGIALLRDRRDGRMRSVEEIQTVVGLPILGVVPAMSGRRTAIARAMTVHLDPRSVVAEAYRTIRTAVYFGTNGAHCKTLLMTSPEPGDGKTTSASNLAIAIAQTGRTVLLLDADFRKPTQHKNLDIKDSVGLSSVLGGRESLDRAIQRTGVDGLDILPCGPIPANPSEILNSREFGELIDSLASRYDHIIFDSPPVNPVTDARILGAVCDATILVLRADKSTRKAGEHARNALVAVGTNILGAIVNDAPHRRGYDSYGNGYYYGTKDRSASAGVIPASRRLTNDSPEANAEARPTQQRRRNIA
jgi:capsular exopolysaccharide synthesis family protein